MVLYLRALPPLPVLLLPVVLYLSALSPFAVLLPPVVLELSAFNTVGGVVAAQNAASIALAGVWGGGSAPTSTPKKNYFRQKNRRKPLAFNVPHTIVDKKFMCGTTLPSQDASVHHLPNIDKRGLLVAEVHL